jgi:hypothetical protein
MPIEEVQTKLCNLGDLMLTGNSWQLAVGGWPMAVGSLQLADMR